MLRRIGPYALLACVRRDDLSATYDAHHGDRTVRLTVACPAVDEIAGLRGYLHRCQRAPVLPIFATGVAGGRLWVAHAEPGQPWQTPASLADIITIGEILRSANAIGASHYGLTPHDLTIADGRVQVDHVRACLDWSVGRNDMGSSSRLNDPRGTAWYEAPELWVGHPRSEQTDLYSLCAIAWQALAGEPAFPGEMSIERTERVLAGPPSPPTNTAVSARVWTALARGLAPRTEDRWPTLAALLAALARA